MASYMTLEDDEMLLDGFIDRDELDQAMVKSPNVEGDEFPLDCCRDRHKSEQAMARHTHGKDVNDAVTSTANTIAKHELCDTGSERPGYHSTSNKDMPPLHRWEDVVELHREALKRRPLTQQPSPHQPDHAFQDASPMAMFAIPRLADQEQLDSAVEGSPCAERMKRR